MANTYTKSNILSILTSKPIRKTWADLQIWLAEKLWIGISFWVCSVQCALVSSTRHDTKS